MKNNKMLFGILVSFVFLATIGFTYAFFSITVNVQGEPKNIEASTGTLSILYTDGNVINVESIEPGWTLTKTFTVKNTGSLKAFYSIDWFSLTNTITNDELVMSATCIQTLDGNTSGTCEGLTTIPVVASVGNIKDNIGIEPGYTHTYTITFLFREISALQNYNQGKTFAGVIHINSSAEAFTLKGTLLNSSSSPVANATIEVHSNIRTGITDANGNFEIDGVEVGNHTISVKDTNSISLATDSMSLLSGDETVISGKTITANKDKSVVQVVITLGENTINTITGLPTLKEKMLSDNIAYADSTSSPYVSSATGINFGAISSDTNGKGLYYTTNTSKTEDGTRVYYYRGDVTNNYVIFGGYCWKIIRTNENNSVRLIYYGVPTNNSCSSVSDTKIALARFNKNYTDNTYIGFMYGESGSNTYALTHSNTYESNIRVVLNAWYNGQQTYNKECTSSQYVDCDFSTLSTKLSDYSDYISDAIYCNDRSIDSRLTNYNIGYGTNMTFYGPSTRLATYKENAKEPTFRCINKSNDGFTLGEYNGGTLGYGNNASIYPVGLITADELVYSGYRMDISNPNSYLARDYYYWTMSPCGMGTDGVSIMTSTSSAVLAGNMYAFSGGIYVVPVISIYSNSKVSSGNGNSDKPYIIDIE